MVDALVYLNSVAAVQSYFNSVISCTPSPCTGSQGVDTFLTTLVNSQLTVWDTTQNATTGQHSVLAYSLASRGLPWEFTVWPALAATSWFWITATNPTMLFDPPASPSGPSSSLIPRNRRQLLMDRLEHRRKAGRRMANFRYGVVSPRRLRRRLMPAGTGKGQKAKRRGKGKLGPGDPPTYYTYDALDNLIEVQQQGGSTDPSQWRTRTFVYDSLSRLTSAANPESGTATYTYDANGNLKTRKDARGITTTYGPYDALNRLPKKTYSNGDPAVTYSYDQGANGVGRLTGMTDAAGSESWSYDAMGRVTADQRKTNGVTKTTSYAYNLDGTLKTLTYPSGRVLSYEVGGAELPLQAADTTTTYAASASYAPQGALAGLALGQNINLTQSYSSRLQPSTIHAVSAGGTDLLDLAYDFGLGTADNGDVRAIVNNRDSTRTQYFAYDGLNRIILANTQASTGGNAWGQAFGYDPWGNLSRITVTQGSAPALSVSVNSNNRISSSGYSYDAAGEALTDSVNTYTWNAEGKTATVSNSLYGSETYSYDGQGQRVMKKTAGKLYWYGTDGNVLSESDLSGNIKEEYIFFGGKRIARVDAQRNVDYYLSDSLSSSRVVTDSSGSILDDCDFLPFGDEQCIKSSSGNTYQFTGKERDSESGNDNFGARYYENGLSRFLSPDPLDPTKLAGGALTAYLANPQHWNRYAYTLDNPTTLTDPTGLDACDSDNGACTATVPRETKQQQMEKNQQARGQQQQKGSLWQQVKTAFQTVQTARANANTWVEQHPYVRDLILVVGMVASRGEAGEVEGEAVGEVGETSEGLPKPSLKFETPTNAPQLPPENIPAGWRVRQMSPTEQYPSGYWRLEKPMSNGGWQAIDPSTMKPGTQAQTHVPLPPSGGQ